MNIWLWHVSELSTCKITKMKISNFFILYKCSSEEKRLTLRIAFLYCWVYFKFLIQRISIIIHFRIERIKKGDWNLIYKYMGENIYIYSKRYSFSIFFAQQIERKWNEISRVICRHIKKHIKGKPQKKKQIKINIQQILLIKDFLGGK